MTYSRYTLVEQKIDPHFTGNQQLNHKVDHVQLFTVPTFMSYIDVNQLQTSSCFRKFINNKYRNYRKFINNKYTNFITFLSISVQSTRTLRVYLSVISLTYSYLNYNFWLLTDL